MTLYLRTYSAVYFVINDRNIPHRGLPPCRGGGAYAPMTQTIFNLKQRS